MNDDMSKTPMMVLDKNLRIHTFEEVELGYLENDAIKEAMRCLQCKAPKCVEGCPVNIRIPDFIKCIIEKNIKEAYKIISDDSKLPAICGRVCPKQKQCEGACIRGIKGDSIQIGALERYVADNYKENNIDYKNISKKGKSIGIIGSGPSGLTCAYDLSKEGFDVTIYEALHRPGGVLAYGIPEFRLPNKIVDDEINKLIEMGVNIEYEVVVGKTITIDELLEKHDRLYIANGASSPNFMGIPGENGNGVFSANELLMRYNLMESYDKYSKTPIKVGKNVYVIGGGNVAMDVARTLIRLGSSVTIMYRRDEESMPAFGKEYEEAKEEGINFKFLSNPKEILLDKNNNVIGMECIQMDISDELVNERKIVKKTNKTFKVKCDQVIFALSTSANNIATKDTDILHTKTGLIFTDRTRTTNEKVYAGGDTVTGALTVIKAMEAGRLAASEIINSFNS